MCKCASVSKLFAALLSKYFAQTALLEVVNRQNFISQFHHFKVENPIFRDWVDWVKSGLILVSLECPILSK